MPETSVLDTLLFWGGFAVVLLYLIATKYGAPK